MSPDPAIPLAKVRDICAALPQTDERLSHGSPGFFIQKGKFFAYFWHNHHGDDITAVHVKTSGRGGAGDAGRDGPWFLFRAALSGAKRLDRHAARPARHRLGPRCRPHRDQLGMVAPKRLLDRIA